VTAANAPFDGIYLRLAPPRAGESARVVGITSAGRREGATTIAIGIARAAIRAGAGPVLVVDAAPRGRRAGEMLGVTATTVPAPAHGAFDVGTHIVATPDTEPDVVVLASAAALAGVDAWSDALAALAERYAFIVVDLGDLTGPVPRAWRASLDELVLAVDTTRTTVESLKRLNKDLEHHGLTVDAFVLNKRRFYVPNFLYRFIY